MANLSIEQIKQWKTTVQDFVCNEDEGISSKVFLTKYHMPKSDKGRTKILVQAERCKQFLNISFVTHVLPILYRQVKSHKCAKDSSNMSQATVENIRVPDVSIPQESEESISTHHESSENVAEAALLPSSESGTVTSFKQIQTSSQSVPSVLPNQ